MPILADAILTWLRRVESRPMREMPVADVAFPNMSAMLHGKWRQSQFKTSAYSFEINDGSCDEAHSSRHRVTGTAIELRAGARRSKTVGDS